MSTRFIHTRDYRTMPEYRLMVEEIDRAIRQVYARQHIPLSYRHKNINIFFRNIHILVSQFINVYLYFVQVYKTKKFKFYHRADSHKEESKAFNLF